MQKKKQNYPKHRPKTTESQKVLDTDLKKITLQKIGTFVFLKYCLDSVGGS